MSFSTDQSPVFSVSQRALLRSLYGWMVLMAKWVLVLLIAWDLVTSPVHHHEHVLSLGGSWALPAGSVGHSSEAVATDDDHDHEVFAHAALALWPKAEVPDFSVLVAGAFFTWLTLGLILAASTGVARSRWREHFPAAFSPHRSLPPAGRGPPVPI